MSKETLEWLNTMTLIGNTDNRGNAWHYRAEDQGDEPNHYAGAIPVADVVRRLFFWEPITAPLSVSYLTEDGVQTITDESRKVIVRPDTRTILGAFKDGYEVHGYEEWLLKNVSSILGDTLGISSAGLLKGGAVAWVEVSVPDTITTPEGVAFRPNLLACTSLDGTLATTYKRTVTATVCDNTLSMALGEKGQVVKYKHTRNSQAKIKDARDALAMVHQAEEDFTGIVKALCETAVTDEVWRAFLDIHVPMPEDEGRGRTLAANKRAAFKNLYTNDVRVSPWAGTAFGVLQADNTYRHHVQPIRGTIRAERNAFHALNGTTDEGDALALANLTRALESV